MSRVETRPAPAASEESDPIRRLEQRLAASRDGSERDWLHLMLGIAHFQAQHWKEAGAYLEKVLEKDPDNLSAREMMNTIKSVDKPK